MAGIAILLYRVLGTILVWPLAFFLRNHPNFKGTIAQRLGFVLPGVAAKRKTLWVHAASVGEVKAIAGLLHKIKEYKPDTLICLSSMTETGRNVAKGIPDIELVFPLPFDLSWVMRRYLLKIMPSALIIVETEIWPNMLLSAHDLAIPVVFVNARMSEESFRTYRKLSHLLKAILGPVRVLAMAGPDAQRFSALGASQVKVLGNLKFDAIPRSDSADISSMRESIGAGPRPIFIAGSVREGEEAYVMDAVKMASSEIPDLLSLVAPRHPDRVELIGRLARERLLTWSLRSKGPSSAQVLIIDTMGELFKLYGISDAAFVGGSLVELGGQNILEPIAWGIPTIHGPHMDNFSWAFEAVKGLTMVVTNPSELAHTVTGLIKGSLGQGLGRRAREALHAAGGVTERYLDALGPYL
jgi:3-deoxy-D-manno-octulosonic-acid transferase